MSRTFPTQALSRYRARCGHEKKIFVLQPGRRNSVNENVVGARDSTVIASNRESQPAYGY